MVTFSFGSLATASAATTENTTTAQNYLNTVIAAAENTAAASYAKDYSDSANAYAVAQIKAVSSLIMSGLMDKCDIDTTDGMAAYKADLNKWADIDDTTAPTYIGQANLAFAKGSYEEYYKELAASKDVEGRVADAKAVLDAIDTSIYSTATYTVANKDYTYKSYAEKLIKDAKEELDKITSSSTVKNYGGANGGRVGGDYKDAVNAILYGFQNHNIADSSDSLNIIYTKDTATKSLPSEDYYVESTKVNYYAGVIGKLNALNTVEDQAEADKKDATNLTYAKGVLAYNAEVTWYDLVKVEEGDDVTTGAKSVFYVSSTGKVAGVKVEKATKITKAEATAINAAIAKKIADAVEVLNVYLDELDLTKLLAGTTYVDVVGSPTAYNTGSGLFDKEATSDKLGFKGVIDNTEEARDDYKAAEKVAADMKNAVLFDGTKKYNDADIDAALAKDKTDIYSKCLTNSGYEDYLDDVEGITDEVAVAINAAEKKFQPKMILTGTDKTAEDDKKYCCDYYNADSDTNWNYTLIKEDTLSALDDAKTVAEVNEIMAAADKKLAELKVADDQTAALATAKTKYKDALLQYATEQLKLLNKNETTLTKDYRPASFTDATSSNGITSAYEDGCDLIDDAVNEAALPAAYESAKALFANIKSDAALTAEASEVSKTISALPATVAKDFSTEDQFIAAKKAYDAYLDNYGAQKSDITGYLVFESKLSTLKANQVADVVSDINALADLEPIGTEDKAAVEAVRDKLDKYLDLYEINSTLYDGADDNSVGGDTFDVTAATYKDLKDAESALWRAEVSDVEKTISKLNDNSTEAEIKAAQEAYDALTGSQQRAVKSVVGEALIYKLEKSKANVINAVEALKITASSKASKGAITIKWRVKGDASNIDGYKVYRSTKANKGFKLYKTTTKKTYKNTKNLKKGTKYYYKVIAYKVIDGTTYTSDASNKAFRKAK